jgi:hypothetical protein
MAGVNLNPALTTTASGLFYAQSEGLVQGAFFDDPAIRFELAGGILDSAETLPMWGGIGIFEHIPTEPGNTLGGNVGRATSLTQTAAKGLSGFSVFNQASNWINTPQSPVPTGATGQGVPFFRLGSGARIVVACDPALASLELGSIGQQVSWDLVNQLLVPFLGTLTISSGTYNNTTGVVTLTMSAPITFSPGDAVIISALTGTGAFASLNGTFTALAGTTGSTVVYNAGAGLGASTITGGSLTLGSGASSALACKVLDFNIGNSQIVAYNATTGQATWVKNGNAALILI